MSVDTLIREEIECQVTTRFLSFSDKLDMYAADTARNFHEIRREQAHHSDLLKDLDGRMNNFEGRMNNFEGQMDKFEGRMYKFEGRMDKFEGRMDKFEGRMDKFEGRMESLENKMDQVIELLQNR